MLLCLLYASSIKQRNQTVWDLMPCFMPHDGFNGSRYKIGASHINIIGYFQESNFHNSRINQIFWSLDQRKKPIHIFSNTNKQYLYNLEFPLIIPSVKESSLEFSFFTQIVDNDGFLQPGCQTENYKIYFDDPYIKLSNFSISKKTYIRDIDKTMTLSGTIKCNTNMPKKARIIIDNEYFQSPELAFLQSYQFSIIMNLPNSLPEGSHTLSITVSEDNTTSNTAEISFSYQHTTKKVNQIKLITEESHSMSLWTKDSSNNSEIKRIPLSSSEPRIELESETSIIKKGMYYLNLYIRIYDRRSRMGRITYYYGIDSEIEDRSGAFYKRNPRPYSTELIQIPLYQDLPEGEHNITLYVLNSGGLRSNSESIKFIFTRNTPELVLSEPIKDYYINNIENSIVIDAKVRDRDGDGNVIVSLQINNISLGVNKIISINSTQYTSFRLFYKYRRNEFSDGKHTLKIVATDETNKSTELTRNIQIIYWNPRLELNSPTSELVLTRFINETLIFNYIIAVTNNPCDVTVKYQIDSIHNGSIPSHKFTENTELSSFSSTVTIPDSLSEGNHVIEFWAYDGYKESSRINFTFTYSHNTPGPSVNLDELNYNILYKFRNCTVDVLCSANSQASDVKFINITSLIDDSFEQEHGIIQGKKISQNFSINIPESLNYSIHHISIKACDSSNRCQRSNEIEFVLKNGHPTDKIERYQFSSYRKYRMYERANCLK